MSLISIFTKVIYKGFVTNNYLKVFVLIVIIIKKVMKNYEMSKMWSEL